MVVKINVSISEEVLGEVDKAAREAKISRSSLLTEAVKHFLSEKKAAKEAELRLRAAREIDRIREKASSWDAAAEVIKWRSQH